MSLKCEFWEGTASDDLKSGELLIAYVNHLTVDESVHASAYQGFVQQR